MRSGRSAGFLPARAAGALALFALAVALLAFASPSSASSYGGGEDWTIPPGTSEVDVNETITVNGHLFVEGNLTLINSTVTVLGRIGVAPPPDPGPPPRPSPARESARIYVNGSLTLTNSTLDLFWPFDGSPIPGAIDRIPPGLRVGRNATVTVQDFDNNSATQGDASVITASGALDPSRIGSYSRFLPGSTLLFSNSRALHMGIEGYPGLELNGSNVSVDNSYFRSSLRLLVLNLCEGASVANSTFENVSQPITVRGGSNHRFNSLTIINFTVGLNLTGTADTQLADLNLSFGFPQLNYTGFAPQGSAIALDGGTNLTVLRLGAFGNASNDTNDPLQVFWVRNVSTLTVDFVLVFRPWGLGHIENTTPLYIQGLSGTAFGNGLEVVGCAKVTLLDFALDGNSLYGIDLQGSRDALLSNITAIAWRGLHIQGSSNVTLAGVTLAVTQSGLAVLDTADLAVSGLAVTGTGTGLWLHNVTRGTVDRPQLEFDLFGIQITFSSGIVVMAPSLRSPAGLKANETLFIVESDDVSITGFSFIGTCERAGRADRTARLLLDVFSVVSCDAGLSVTSALDFTLRQASLSGGWNGTALNLANVTAGTIDGAALGGAGDYALAITASYRVRASNIAGSGAGFGGLIVALSAEVDIAGADFSLSGGVGVLLLNATGRVSLLHVNASGGHEGIQVLGSPFTSLEDFLADDNSGEGVYIDPSSPGASLRDLTTARNGANGLTVGASGVNFINGNVSGNRGYGIDASPGVRLDWTIEVAGSLTDDEWRLTGDLLVLGGASFTARNARIRVDAGPNLFDPDPQYRIEVRARATFENVTLEPVNSTRAHGVLFDQNSSVEIRASLWIGGARSDARSAVRALGELVVDGSNFTGWAQPIQFDGDVATLTNTIFTDNAQGPLFQGSFAFLTNVTSELEEGDGLILRALGQADIVDGELRFNSGVGLRAGQVGVLRIDGLNISLNLQGGAAVTDSELTATGLTVAVNNILGLYITGGQRVELIDFVGRANTGRSLYITQTRAADLANFSVTYGGGVGLELEAVGTASLSVGELFLNGAGGLFARDVGELHVDGVRFEANANYQVTLAGGTVATITNSSFVTAPGDAVVLSDGARAFVIEAALAGAVGRVRAGDSSYAYVLNTSFTGPSVTALAQVDIAWDLRVTVVALSGAPAPGAAIEVKNQTGTVVAQATSGPAGDSPLIAVLQQSVFSSGRVSRFSPHLVSVSLAGQGGARASVDIDRFTQLVLVLDAQAPTLSAFIDGTRGANGWYLSDVTITLEARDEGPTGLTVRWRLDGGAWQNETAPGNFVSTFFNLDSEGEVLVEYTALDGVGNARAVNSTLIKIDLEVPTLTWGEAPSVVRGPSVVLQWIGQDGEGSGLARYDISVSLDGAPETTWLSNSTATTAVFTAQWEGSYTLQLAGTDLAGRSARPVKLTFEVRILGTLRLAVLDGDGLPLHTAIVEVVGGNDTRTGAGDLSFRLTEGHYQVRVHAPGFETKLLDAQVVAGNVTDLGTVRLQRVGEASTGPDLSILFLGLLAAAAAAVAAIFLTMRSRGRKRVE
jgi:hypothetical protein